MLLLIYFEYYLCQIHWKQRREKVPTMESLEKELKSISKELKNLSLKREQLQERKTLHCAFQELRTNTESKQTEETVSNQREIDNINDKLKQAAERTAELQKRLENIGNSKDKNQSKVFVTPSLTVIADVPVPATNIVSVEAPPVIPEEAASNQHEPVNTDDKPKRETEKTTELRKKLENMLIFKYKNNMSKVNFTSSQMVVPGVSVLASNIVSVKAAPAIPEAAASSQHEIEKQLTERKAELQKSQEVAPDVPDPVSDVVYVEPPPSIPAPTVILDLEKFPTSPCRTQCPECQQFVMTETFTSVSSITWLVCIMTALIGCVAGCCLLPFCCDRFKSTIHKCPKCRSSIHTIKKL